MLHAYHPPLVSARNPRGSEAALDETLQETSPPRARSATTTCGRNNAGNQTLKAANMSAPRGKSRTEMVGCRDVEVLPGRNPGRELLPLFETKRSCARTQDLSCIEQVGT